MRVAAPPISPWVVAQHIRRFWVYVGNRDLGIISGLLVIRSQSAASSKWSF
jgi:hypothetical protein